jgi:carbon-monoxide dehydrogenase medium subunit
MKTPPFDFAAPDTLEEVLDLLAEHGDEAKVIAGGQSLMPMLAMRLARPSILVDVTRVAALGGIEERNGHVVFGATARERDAERSALVARATPVLAESLPFIGHVSIRNRGTIGGSIAHADASAELPAVAVLTEAEMAVANREGERVIAAADFFRGHFATALADEDCLVEVRVPTTPPGAGWSFQEIARRHGDFALVGAGAMVTRDDAGAIGEARVCLFGVADRPVRAREVEASLVGSPASAESIAEATAEVVRGLDPSSDAQGSAAHRRQLASVVVRKALTVAAERAGVTA